MKRASVVSCLLLVAVMSAACSSSRHDPRATQENFGVNMARMNLWREALFRFKRAVQMSPGNPTAHNNLAVAYEANGDFDNAAKEYREAMRLDKSNQYIQKNYSRFIEFTSRNKKRQKRDTATAPKTAAAETPSAPATPGTTAPAPAGTSGNAPGSSAQPTGTAPATTPPTASAPPAPPPPDAAPPQPAPTKPPGDHP
ncbi:MAG: tetratricopeptide repeat protein [Thermoanaerobaculia bacterium]